MLQAEPYRARILHGRRAGLRLRMAEPRDGETIGNLVRYAGWGVDGVKWDDIGANWLVVELDDFICGCIEVLPGKPFGRLECLGVEPELSPQTRGRVVRLLIRQGLATLKLFGSQVASIVVPEKYDSYAKALQRRGCSVLSDGVVMVRRL